MVHIPKHMKQSLCNSSNYRVITLGSIFSKTPKWVIIIKGGSPLCSSNLQFDFKRGCPQRGALIVCQIRFITIILINIMYLLLCWVLIKLLIELITVNKF